MGWKLFGGNLQGWSEDYGMSVRFFLGMTGLGWLCKKWTISFEDEKFDFLLWKNKKISLLHKGCIGFMLRKDRRLFWQNFTKFGWTGWKLDCSGWKVGYWGENWKFDFGQREIKNFNGNKNFALDFDKGWNKEGLDEISHCWDERNENWIVNSGKILARLRRKNLFRTVGKEKLHLKWKDESWNSFGMGLGRKWQIFKLLGWKEKILGCKKWTWFYCVKYRISYRFWLWSIGMRDENNLG